MISVFGIFQRRFFMRKTKVICTIGPACDNEETLTKMCKEGMNVARLNFSHGTHEDHQEKIDLIKKVREKLGLPIAIMLDTKGPEYRIKTFENKKITLNDGDTFTFTIDDVVGNEQRVSVNYDHLTDDLSAGDRILVNNGLVIFEVNEICGHDVVCKVITGGELSAIFEQVPFKAIGLLILLALPVSALKSIMLCLFALRYRKHITTSDNESYSLPVSGTPCTETKEVITPEETPDTEVSEKENTEATEAAPNFCFMCGNPVDGEQNFCSHCGNNLTQ